MIAILSLKPEDEKRLNPHALKRFNDWQDRIMRQAPQLGQLSIEQTRADLRTHLHDNELAEYSKCLSDITRWLSECMDTGDRYFPHAYDTQVITPMSRVESLIVRAYQLKEVERKWRTACKAVNPPLNDAKMYFGDEEYDEFIRAARQAIQVYTEKGEGYLDDLRSFDYRWSLEKIRGRKEKERQKIAANVAAQEYNRRLNEEKTRLKASLCPARKDHQTYFKKQVRDRRYAGQNLTRLVSMKEEQDFDKVIVEISKKRVEELVSTDFCFFTASKCWRSFFLLPSADYILKEVPCLGFIFDVFAVVETGVWLKPGQKEFNGYVFDFPWGEKKEGTSGKTQELLGYHHFVLTPEELGGWSFWQDIPLVLLKGLLSGETQPSETVIVSASDDAVTYEVEGFAKTVEIPTQFAAFLEHIGSIDEMVGMGIMTNKVGNIVKAALAELEVNRKTSPAREKSTGGNSVKEKAFHLFDEDKRPGDAEVKSLGIKPNTAYRYYQEWKKTQITPSSGVIRVINHSGNHSGKSWWQS